MKRILYLYNKENWALHNVGKLWFSDPPRDVLIDMADYHKLDREYFLKYDYVWFSLYIYEKFNFDVSRSVIIIHDPIELFPEKINWLSERIPDEKINLLRRFRYIIVISKEIEEILHSYGISVIRIPISSI